MMTNADQDGFRALLDAMGERFGRQPMSAVAAGLSFAAIQDELPDVTITELTHASRRLLKSAKFMPTDADLIDAVIEDRDKRSDPRYRPFALPAPYMSRDETRRIIIGLRKGLQERGLEVKGFVKLLGDDNKPHRLSSLEPKITDPHPLSDALTPAEQAERKRVAREVAERLVGIEFGDPFAEDDE